MLRFTKARSMSEPPGEHAIIKLGFSSDRKLPWSIWQQIRARLQTSNFLILMLKLLEFYDNGRALIFCFIIWTSGYFMLEEMRAPGERRLKIVHKFYRTRTFMVTLYIKIMFFWKPIVYSSYPPKANLINFHQALLSPRKLRSWSSDESDTKNVTLI